MQHPHPTRTNVRHIPRLADGPSAAQWVATLRRRAFIAALLIIGLPAVTVLATALRAFP